MFVCLVFVLSCLARQFRSRVSVISIVGETGGTIRSAS